MRMFDVVVIMKEKRLKWLFFTATFLASLFYRKYFSLPKIYIDKFLNTAYTYYIVNQ